MRYGRLVGIFVLAAAAVVDGARADGFRTPSDNIHCLAEEWEGEAWLRCDIRASTAPAPPRPADCELDWGHAFTVSENALPATPACAGDTVLDPSYPILHYGSKWSSTASSVPSKPMASPVATRMETAFRFRRSSRC